MRGLRAGNLASSRCAIGLLAGSGIGAGAHRNQDRRRHATDHAAAFIGIERGIFAKHGLDAKMVMYQTGVEMINGLLADAQDVNIMGSIPFLAGVSNGQPLVLIGHLHGDAPSRLQPEHSIVATRDRHRPGRHQGPQGKRIALPAAPAQRATCSVILRSNGMSATR